MRPCARQLVVGMLTASIAVSCSSANNNPGGAYPGTPPGSSGESPAATCIRQTSVGSPPESPTTALPLDKVYQDESHCLTLADMRGDRDIAISCSCRDAIVDSRYVYFTYLHSGKDRNLNGVFLTLEGRIPEQCGKTYDALDVATRENWKWDGPEVVRTYPSDDVISRIKPETRGGKAVGRWVPFTVQLIYRDDESHVTRTENYSSQELLPVIK